MWMKTYPRLMDQMRDIMEEWKEEREQLLINAEQTHAYCQSLAFQVRAWRFVVQRRASALWTVRARGRRSVTDPRARAQVKSMQEENGRLQAENSELSARQGELERELTQLRAKPDDRGRAPSNLEEDVQARPIGVSASSFGRH